MYRRNHLPADFCLGLCMYVRQQDGFSVCRQAQRPTLVISLRFLKGGLTFVGLSAVTASASSSSHLKGGDAAAAALTSQQAGLPEKLGSVLSEQGVFLPQAVSAETACSPQFFTLAHQNRMAAGLWVRNSSLHNVLTHLIKP